MTKLTLVLRSRTKGRAAAGMGLALSLIFAARVVVHANSAQDQSGQTQSTHQNENISERTERRGSQLLIRQTQDEADAKTRGCMSSGCHNPVDSTTMHAPGTVRLGCTDCHGGDASVMNTAAKDSVAYGEAKNK